MTSSAVLSFLSVVMTVILSNTDGLRVTSCSSNPSNDKIKVLRASINPEPVRLPGNFHVGGEVETLEDLQGTIDVDLTVKKKLFFFYINMPCVSGVGSCSYRDICNLTSPHTKLCTDVLTPLGYPCTCPIPRGRYTFPPQFVTVGSLGPTLNFLASGKYQIYARIKNRDSGQQLACIKAETRVA